MGLSRQMEYHADAISAFVTGSNHLPTSLQRIEISGICFNQLLAVYEGWLKEDLRPVNLYEQHTEIMRHFAKDHHYQFANNLIEPDEEKFSKLHFSKVRFDDQWASHPTFEQRAEHLGSIPLITETVTDSAWTLFADPGQIENGFYR